MVILNRRLIVKIYSPLWSEIDVESKLIKILGIDGSVPVPKIVTVQSSA